MTIKGEDIPHFPGSKRLARWNEEEFEGTAETL
jgi:hypothetical protein